ncbi:LysR family transcriptional regulator [Pseudomonas sp. NBRC 111123]|uniref:LysR family transcriptional regulator n=1 Tax=Pseudomonas sp. NBRC 111123 TaxID=1661038 RepID=UPI0009E9FADA|nr:LysR family transcriptional regulator [Pseudomonas sp. NBRC 111123]
MAARELGVTQAAVSTQIRQLEGNLGGGQLLHCLALSRFTEPHRRPHGRRHHRASRGGRCGCRHRHAPSVHGL